jgi:predicted acylesterase/phospholipase RssA
MTNLIAPFFRALLRCWFVVVLFAGLMYFFSAIEQGREGLRAASYETPVVLVLVLSMIVLTTTAALTRLRVWPMPSATPGERFAHAAVPPLVTVGAAFSLAVAVGVAGSKALQVDPAVERLSTAFLVVGGFAIAAERVMLEVSEPNALWRERFERGLVPVCAISAAAVGLTLGWLVWASFALSVVAVLAGAVVSARRREPAGRSVRPPLSLTIGFGGVFAAFGCIAAWNHAENPVVAIGIVSGPFLALMVVAGGWMGLAFMVELLKLAIHSIPVGWPRWLLQSFACMAALAVVVLFLTGPYNEAMVNPLAKASMPAIEAPAARNLEQHATAWIEQRRTAIEAGPGRYPIIVVAAEGGGIRAAYWAATVLSDLHDQVPGFTNHVYAVSGVSGGSVGASVYAALVHHQRTGGAPCGKSSGIGDCALSVMGADLLSAPLIGTLVGDVLRTTTRSARWPDRAQVLDGVFVEAWQRVVGTPRMARAFGEMWADPTLALSIPLLTPNATSAVTGRRAVLSPLSPDIASGSRADWLFDPEHPMSLASATLVSARFPLVSPTALLAGAPGRPPTRLVDGGYSDNSGAATAQDLLHALLAAAEQLSLADRLQPLVLLLRNSPDALTEAAAGGARSQVLGTLFEPAATLDGVRSQLALRYVEELKAFVTARQGIVLDGLRLQSEAEPYALGWMLSRHTREEIDAHRRTLMTSFEPLLCKLLDAAGCR